MNKTEIIGMIKMAGGNLRGVMGTLYGEKYEAGYNRALSDMVHIFESAPVPPTYSEERLELVGNIKALAEHNDALLTQNAVLLAELEKRDNILHMLLSQLSVADLLEITVQGGKGKRKGNRPGRGVRR